jgi:hypothetical protein
MAKTPPRQRKTEGRVMHEYKHGELSRGRAGGKVKSRKQAIAIALHEAGASNEQSPKEKRKARAKSSRDEARGETGQQRREGRAKVGAAPRKRKSAGIAAKRKATRKATRKTAKKASGRKRKAVRRTKKG